MDFVPTIFEVLAQAKACHQAGQLPEAVQRVADAKYDLLRTDPHHPSLHFKRVGRLWSVWGSAIEHWRWTATMGLCGSGSGRTANMTRSFIERNEHAQPANVQRSPERNL